MDIPFLIKSFIELIVIGSCTWFAITYIGGKVIGEAIKEGTSTLFAKQKTQLVESAKKEFNESLELFKKTIQIDIANKVEPLRADLSRNNIAFQINETEYVKRRFIHLEILFAKAYEIFRTIKDNIQPYKYQAQNLFIQDETVKQILEIERDYSKTIYISSPYLDEKSRDVLFNYGLRIHSLLTTYEKYSIEKNAYNSREAHNFSIQYVEDDGTFVDDTMTKEQISLDYKKLYGLHGDIINSLAEFEISFNEVDRTIKGSLSRQ